MDLATLAFKVDTKELEDAAAKVAELGTAVSKLNKPMQNLTKESAKTNKELSKAEEAAAKAALAQAKLEQAQAKSAQTAAKSSSVLERQNLILEYMAQGNSKGQASILATAKAAGALDDEMLALNKTLVTQRTLIGGDPFDKSIGLMQKLQNEYKTTTEITNLFNKNLGLTQKQMTDLAREKERLIALYGIEGKSLNGLSAEYEQLIQKSVKVNQANDARTNSMKAQIKAQNDTAKANEYMSQELERVNRLTESGGNITIATNNKLIKFEQALKASGATAAEQVSKLEAYRQKLLSIQKAGGDRQIDYLSRALGPQITDIAVGLATGQAPLTILLQQGGQLRDQFALAGVEGSKMGEMLVKAAGSMITSIKDVGMAVGQVFVTAIAGAGKSVTNFAMQITGTSFLLDTFRTKLVSIGGASSSAVAIFDKLGKAMTLTVGVAIFAAIGLLIGLVVQYSKVVAAEKELTASLAMSGAALAMSTEDAIKYAESMNAVGVGTMDAMRMIAEFANTGTDASIPFEQIIKSAQDMQKYVGIASADTMKAFADISEKPVEGLIKLAKSTGNVTAETILQAEAAVKAGNNAEAARIAQEALSNSNSEVVKRMKNNLDPLQTLWMDIKSGISQAGEALYDFLKSSTTVAVFRTVWETIAVIVTEVWYVLKQTGNEISGIFSQIKAVMSGDFAGAARIGNQMKIDAEAAKVAQDKLVASIMNRNKAEKETLTITEDQRKANRQAAKEIEDRIKKEGKGTKAKETKELTELEKERIQFLKVMSDIEDKASGFTKNYSDQLNSLNIGLTEGWLTQDQFNIKLQELNKIQPGVIKAHKDHADAIEKFTQVQKKADDALFDSLDVQHQLNMQILEQADLLALEGSLIGATDVERKKALATKRLDLQLEKEIIAIKKSPVSATEQEAQIARARQRRLDAEKNLNTEIANDFAAEMQKQYDAIKNGLTDATIAALFEGGKAGSKKLRDLIVAELKKPITIVVKAVVDVASAASSKLVNTGLNYLSNIALGGSTVGASLGAFGAGAAANIGAGAPVVSMGSATSAAFNAGASASQMAMTAGPYVLAAVAALNALGAFRSTKTVGGGLTGTLGAGDVQSYELTRRSGTLFNGPSYGVANMQTSPQAIALEDAFTAIRTSTAKMAETLGLSADKVKTFTMAVGDVKVHPDIDKFGIVLDGLSDEQKVQKIDEVLTKSSDAMAELVLGAGATAEKLVQLYNSVLQERFGLETQLLELQGDTTALRARERDQLHESNRALYDQINALKDKQEADRIAAQEAEKYTKIVEDLAKEEFNLQIELLQVKGKTEEANEALRSLAITGLKDTEVAAYDFNQSLKAQIQGYKDAKVAAQAAKVTAQNLAKAASQATDSAYASLERAVNAEKAAIDVSIQSKQKDIDSLKKRQDVVSNSLNSLNNIFELISKNVKELYAEVESTSTMSASSARSFIGQSIAGFRNGISPDSEKLSDAIGTVRTTLDKTYFKTKADSDRERLLFANELSTLQELTSDQISNEEKIVRSLEKQISNAENQIMLLNQQKEKLDEVLLDAKTQIEALRDIDKSVISVATAINNLAAALKIETTVKGTSIVGPSGYTQDEIVSAARDIQSKASNWDQADYNIGIAAINAGVSSSELATALGVTQDYVLQRAEELGIPKFAAGGSYSGGLALVGEQGPELINFNQGGQVYNAGQTAGLLSGSSSEELAAIREELVMLRAETRAVVSNTSKTSKLLDRASPDGQSLQVTVLA